MQSGGPTLTAGDFAGAWTINRQIEDRFAQQTGRFTGTAMFVPEGGGIVYSETGTLTLGEGPSFQAERRYLWIFHPDGVDVRFDDGRPFHSFVPEGLSPGTDHPCGADFYRVRYDFTCWPKWTAHWTVTGPRKDYDMWSAYHRA